MPLAPGFRLDSYEIITPLGAGGMGEVYRARDIALKRDVAIKVLPGYASRDPDRLRRFEIEAQAAAALNHPNIVSIFHVGQCDGSPYIVTELLQGESLRDRLHRGPLRVPEVLDKSIELARGLGAAHEAGIVHRDLKPENLFVTKDGRIKILDFGLAKLDLAKAVDSDGPTVTFRQPTVPGQVLGTVGYMAPEQVRGEAADARSDIFAVGVILYEMLTGKRPFQRATSAETMTAILKEDPPPLPHPGGGVPPGLKRIVNRCLAKAPEQRFQHASDLAFAMEALSDASGDMYPVASGTADSRKKWRWVGAAAVAVVVVAVGVWWRTRTPAVPIVEAVTQISNDGMPKNSFVRLATDGPRVYFTEGVVGTETLVEVAATGGPTAVLPIKVTNPEIAALSPDNSTLLIQQVAPGPGTADVNALWAVPLPAGDPRRIGDIDLNGATYLPDGRILFLRGNDFSVAENDGSNARKLVSIEIGWTQLGQPTVSPEGSHIAFTATPKDRYRSTSIMQMNADGSDLMAIAESTPTGPVCCPAWTKDGKYLVYAKNQQGMWNLWASPVSRTLLRRSSTPVQLTNGPLSYAQTIPSLDGTKLYAVGNRLRGELVRYDQQAKQFFAALSGISAFDVTYSADGEWVAYTAYPDGTLWRSRADGSERMQLTFPPMQVLLPFISPNGKQVAFSDYYDFKGYIISMEGGVPERISEEGIIGPNWSPDGKRLIMTLARRVNDAQPALFDLQTRVLSIPPSSTGFTGGQWVSQEKFVAYSLKAARLMLFDLKKQVWSDPGVGNALNWAHSLDYKYLYYTVGGAEPGAMRIRLADGKLEFIASLKDLRRAMRFGGYTQISVAPDGSPVFTRDLSTQEIYSLTVKWP
jgi:serine/threonine protein kinase